MAKKGKDYVTGIPQHEMESLARLLLPTMQAFFESEEGKRCLRNVSGRRPKGRRGGMKQIPR